MSTTEGFDIDANEQHAPAPASAGEAAGGKRAGFRLDRFEVFNWGTFDQRVWRLQPGGDSILLTGDIGSGKSTLVDALTTLLVAPHKLSYNKAAGADAHERSLRTYVMGHYKSERGESSAGARAVGLRDHNSYSALLAVFADDATGEAATLAQVFWLKDPHGQPERFYVVADSRLSIAEHFAGFGADIANLRKRLRATGGVAVYDTFLPYGADFRRRFGIGGEQAMDLFHQTVSMKSVGDLTGFVREHILDAFPVEGRIGALVAHVDDLNRTHEAVLKARAQIDRLVPLAADCDRYTALAQRVAMRRGCRSALRPWFAALRRELLEQRIRDLQGQVEAAADTLAGLSERRRNQVQLRDALTEAIATQGGNRIGQLGAEIARHERTRDERTARAEQYGGVAAAVGLPGAAGAATFAANRRAIADGQAACVGRRDDAATRLTEAGVLVRELGRQYGESTAELDSLRRRGTNIPRAMVELRATLCEDLRLHPETLPFVGELVRVRDGEQSWEGAVERVLHGFALSLLVPEVHAAAVEAWASRRHVGARLSFYRVRAGGATQPRTPHPDSLVRKLTVKSDSPHAQWLLAELGHRFDYACCEGRQQFRREKLALTRDGEVRGADERYEQDGRRPLGERAHYVLGWSNEAKVAALTKQERDLATRVQAQVAQVTALKREVDEQNTMLGHWQQLAIYNNFKELDWKAAASMIEQLERERQELAVSTDTLGTLQRQSDALKAAQELTAAGLDDATRAHAGLAAQLAQATSALADCGASDLPALDAVAPHATELERLTQEALGGRGLIPESCDRCEGDVREVLLALIENEEKDLLPLRDATIGAMREYVRMWPVDTREVDVGIDAAAEFARMLDVLQAKDLPRFVQRFKELLNESTIREIADFQSQLQREREIVRDRIEGINAALRAIDYNPGRYVSLEMEANPDAELRDFQQELRACIDGAMATATDEAHAETRFLRVKRIIERFRGREGSVDMDQRWMRKVTDVRNWFVFSASERWREDDREYEHYTDGGGKSGGQKEKLAYTVLAAGLTCQFGLAASEERARSFRFAVIDEAFGRGSDESARYGLELFRRMDLQLLIVTPLQKIHIIEPYVAGLGFVHNEAGRQSMLRYLSIGEYQVERGTRRG